MRSTLLLKQGIVLTFATLHHAETGCRVVFPTKDDEFADTVMIIGRKEDVKKAKEMLQTMVKEQVRTHSCPNIHSDCSACSTEVWSTQVNVQRYRS
jgi:hypothetical protein